MTVNREVTRPPGPRLMPAEDAWAADILCLGTCDWGNCSREAWGVRWSSEHGYLTVCQPCSRSTWAPEHGRRFAR